MSLAVEIWELVRAGFPGIWIETHEPTEAELELATLGREHDLRVIHCVALAGDTAFSWGHSGLMVEAILEIF